MMQRSKIELLAPAGDEECFKAAIAAGADAVYFGLEQFSARTRAKNLTVEQAKYLIPLAHEHNCRAYLTLNTLIKDEEMKDAISLVEKAADCGVDAIIVQDLGVLDLIHKNFPAMELHASTQMTTHNISQCKYLSELGVSQVNLSRELSLQEIQKITAFLHSKNIIPEIFVQGAFCISYSGQCYLSGHLYNQAGNRGDCVQPCRRNWCSCSSSSGKPLDYKALFHLKDNSAFPLADKLINENLPLSLKIEGRIKNAEYVWAVTSAWREQIDLILGDRPILKSSPKLTGAINRDYTCGYLEGNINSNMFSSGTKDISQVKAGTVKNYLADSKTLILNNGELNKGDRLTIKTADNQFICTANVTGKSGNSYTIQITNKLTKKILNGQIIYKSSSVVTPDQIAKIIEKLSPATMNSEKLYKADISVKVLENKPIEITYYSEGEQITVKSAQPLVKAQNAGLTIETLQQKLSKLGGTCFTFGVLTAQKFEPDLFISLGELNNLRRKAIEQLTEIITEKQASNTYKKQDPVLQLPVEKKSKVLSSEEAFLIDNQKDLEQLLLEKSYGKKNFKILYEIPSAINLVNDSLFDLLNRNPDIILYFNSILMDEDLDGTVNFINRFENISQREILCENTGLAYELKHLNCKVILGPNCNLYNSWNIQKYNESLNLKGVLPSLELSPEEVGKLHFPANLEVWYPKKIHQLLMQSRQCLVRNGSGCTKGRVERGCIENCQKKLSLEGLQKEKILAVKRPGFYSALYSEEMKKVESSFLEDIVSVWIIDKRF